MISFNIKISNRDEIERKLAKIGVELADFSGELKSVGQYLVNYFSRDVFATLGRVYGQRWADVTPQRLAYKMIHYPQNAHATLQATGFMRNNFFFQSSRDFLKIQNRATYFIQHQLGNDYMPQRVMMALNRANKDGIVTIVTKGIQERIAKAG